MWGKFEQRLFVTKLAACEESFNTLSIFERGFISDMREKFDHRDQDVQYGGRQWEPSAKQLNFLESIAAGR